MSFTEARSFARRLKIRTLKEWQLYAKSRHRPHNLPSMPSIVYQKNGWGGFSDFLGTNNISKINFIYRPFRHARAYVRRLGLKSTYDWYEYVSGKSSRWGKKPRDIPSKPSDVYKKAGWSSMNDWIGHGISWKHIRTNYSSYEQACKVVRALGIRTQRDFYTYCKTPNRPKTLPYQPHKVYEGKGWVSWPHFLGTNVR